MDVRTYLRAIRKSWWLIVVTALLGGVAGYAYSARQTPVYAASVGFYVSTRVTGDQVNAQSTDQYAQDEAINLAKLVSSDRTARAVQDQGVDLPYQAIAPKITGTAALNTAILSVSVADTSKSRALAIARALAVRFPLVVKRFSPQGNAAATVKVLVQDYPSVSPAPVLPRTNLNVAFGFVVGLVLGLLLAVLRLLRDTSVRTREDAERIGGAPLVGDIGFDTSARSAPLVLERQAHSVRAEAFRQLRTSLQFVDAAGHLQVVVVTSSTESEGKSTTAINLALMFSETVGSVLLIGADLRRPRVAQYLGLESSIGLTNVLVNQVTLDDALQSWGSDGMYVLAGGAVPPNPSELLDSPHMADVLRQLRERFDLIIIDTPPLLPVTDAAVLATHADGVVVVCRHGRTKRAQLGVAMRALQAVNARVVGMVLTMRPSRGPDSQHYGSYRYYGESTHGRVRLALARVARRIAQVPVLAKVPFVTRYAEEAWVPIDLVSPDLGSLTPASPVTKRRSGRAQSVSATAAARRRRASQRTGDGSFESIVGAPPEEDALPQTAIAAFHRRQQRAHRGRRRAILHTSIPVAVGAGRQPAEAGEPFGPIDGRVIGAHRIANDQRDLFDDIVQHGLAGPQPEADDPSAAGGPADGATADTGSTEPDRHDGDVRDDSDIRDDSDESDESDDAPADAGGPAQDSPAQLPEEGPARAVDTDDDLLRAELSEELDGEEVAARHPAGRR